MELIRIQELLFMQDVREANIEMYNMNCMPVNEDIKIIHNGKNYAVILQDIGGGMVRVVNIAKINDLNGVPYENFIESLKIASEMYC